MELNEAKETFIQAWGNLGSSWGINRTMAQVHALLLVSKDSLSSDEIMEALDISRGNANMNIRALIEWGLVFKENKVGERREYFYGEKDVWRIMQKIIEQRKKKELNPIVDLLDDLSQVENKNDDVSEFLSVIQDIQYFALKTDKVLDKLVNKDPNWIVNLLLKAV